MIRQFTFLSPYIKTVISGATQVDYPVLFLAGIYWLAVGKHYLRNPILVSTKKTGSEMLWSLCD